MRIAPTPLCLACTACALLLACSDPSSTRKPDGAAAADGQDAVGVGFTAAACKADTCSAEALKCAWNSSDARYAGCLTDCDLLGTANLHCPEEVAALYTCASLGAKVDCTTGKGTGCYTEEQQVGTCLQIADAGP